MLSQSTVISVNKLYFTALCCLSVFVKDFLQLRKDNYADRWIVN